jgi:adenylyl cyclase-associated protein
MDALAPLNSLLDSLNARLASVEAKLGIETPAAGAGGASAAPVEEPVPPHVMEWDMLMGNQLKKFLDVAAKIGDKADAVANCVKDAFAFDRAWMLMAARCKKPSMEVIGEKMAGFKAVAKAAGDLKDRSSPFINHVTGVIEGMGALQWVAVEPMTVPVIEGQIDAAQFYLNKVRMEHRGKNQDHVDFCNLFTAALKAVLEFAKEHAKMGLAWNPRGRDAANYELDGAPSSAATAAAPAAAAAPAPAAPAAASGGGGGTSDLFAELKKIDQSGGRTAGLRHVTKDMKTKNQKDKPAAAPKAGGGGGGAALLGAPKAPKAAAAKPPRTELVKTRWFVENHVGTHAPIILEDVNIKQEVYIYGCNAATIIIKAKCKALTIDKCTKCKILFHSAVSTCELVNCQRMQVQVQDKVHSIAVDKTDGCVLYLSAASKGAQVVTSKCSELNISFPTSDAEDADWAELPIPEQFVSTLVGGKVETRVSDLYSEQ